jgi:hypothetical protein
VVQVEFSMKIQLTEWKENKNSVSVNYGPLTFSLKIKKSIKKKIVKHPRHQIRVGRQAPMQASGLLMKFTPQVTGIMVCY